MRRPVKIWFIILAIVLMVVIVLESVTSIRPNIGESRKFFCDVKLLTIRTNIAVKQDGEKIADIRGKALRIFADPLTMYDLQGNSIAYGADEYHLISQDSHQIYVDNHFVAEMVGKFKIFGDSYDIYDASGNLVAKAHFNAFNTYGKLEGLDGTLWADYYSNLLRLDYEVRIKADCKFDDDTILMMMASFYSDRSADSRSSGSSHSSSD